MDIGTLKNLYAAYIGRSSAADLNPSTLTPAGPNIDLGLVAANNARRAAERAHDFRFSELNLSLNITSAGGLLSTAYSDATPTVTGTVSPSVDGVYNYAGIYNGLPFYAQPVSPPMFFLFYNGTAWILTADLNFSADYWNLITASASPNGTYAANGAYSGTPIVTTGAAAIAVKRVKYVSLPLDDSTFEPVEFVAQDQFEARLRELTGRTQFVSSATLPSLGYSLAYQLGQTVYLTPGSATLPIVAQLSVVQWLPDYTMDADTDFFTQYGSDYLQWAGILEVNKLFRRFAPKQEGNIDEPAIQAAADAALQEFIAWDNSITKGASEFSMPPFQSFEGYESPKPASAQSTPA